MTWDEADPEPDLGPVSESELAEAARRVAANPDVQNALQSVVDLAMASVQCLGASVTLVRPDGGAETTATSTGSSSRPTTCSTRSTRVPAWRRRDGRRLQDRRNRQPTHAGPLGPGGGRPWVCTAC